MSNEPNDDFGFEGFEDLDGPGALGPELATESAPLEGTDQPAAAPQKPSQPAVSDSGSQGLTSAGQYALASCCAMLGAYIVLAVVYLGSGDAWPDFGLCVILTPISLVSLYCACIGLIAKPQGKEWIFMLPGLGPILPLLTVLLCVYVFVFSGGA